MLNIYLQHTVHKSKSPVLKSLFQCNSLQPRTLVMLMQTIPFTLMVVLCAVMLYGHICNVLEDHIASISRAEAWYMDDGSTNEIVESYFCNFSSCVYTQYKLLESHAFPSIPQSTRSMSY
jgi:hypothetical protein